MNPFVAYTLARFGLFLAAFGLVWLAGFSWLEWNSLNVLWTMLVALVISAAAGIVLLRGLRERLAARVQDRAERMSQRFEESRGAEDVD
ncbi:DUF4229 domain-containing protein [Solicola gregarius]|uniref:DUF4229 domain-containing protein n=1 Tax=Solicola gregarius TaxID=2908642 RepID=A0AA46TKF2_9ACTN|nr:DUF4229 domain-containing protein [Solicola gregarius]UYM06921.1 DUF4229 domain-containing protein [Solicola gregarius]